MCKFSFLPGSGLRGLQACSVGRQSWPVVGAQSIGCVPLKGSAPSAAADPSTPIASRQSLFMSRLPQVCAFASTLLRAGVDVAECTRDFAGAAERDEAPARRCLPAPLRLERNHGLADVTTGRV